MKYYKRNYIKWLLYIVSYVEHIIKNRKNKNINSQVDAYPVNIEYNYETIKEKIKIYKYNNIKKEYEYE